MFYCDTSLLFSSIVLLSCAITIMWHNISQYSGYWYQLMVCAFNAIPIKDKKLPKLSQVNFKVENSTYSSQSTHVKTTSCKQKTYENKAKKICIIFVHEVDDWWPWWVWVRECFFWYRLTRVFPDKIHKAVKWLCVCVCVLSHELDDEYKIIKTKHYSD